MLSSKDKLTADYEQLQHLERFTKELRESVQERASRETPTEDEQRAMVAMRARADELYRDAGLVGSPMPLPFERGDSYRKRVMSDLARIGASPWAGKDLKSIKDEAALSAVETQVFDAAKANAKSYGLKDGELREIRTDSRGGHRQVEFVGGKNAWFGNAFSRVVPRVAFKTRDQYNQVVANNALSRLTHVVPTYLRSIFPLNGGTA